MNAVRDVLAWIGVLAIALLFWACVFAVGDFYTEQKVLKVRVERLERQVKDLEKKGG